MLWFSFLICKMVEKGNGDYSLDYPNFNMYFIVFCILMFLYNKNYIKIGFKSNSLELYV